MATQDKYDRQLRMWGSDGQRRLNGSRILCLGISSTGTETIKNLVLPGVGYFEIVSDRVVTKRDLGNNFFLPPEFVGKSYASAALETLLELNPDVSGKATDMCPKKYFKENLSGKPCQFSLIICDGLDFVIPTLTRPRARR